MLFIRYVYLLTDHESKKKNNLADAFFNRSKKKKSSINSYEVENTTRISVK